MIKYVLSFLIITFSIFNLANAAVPPEVPGKRTYSVFSPYSHEGDAGEEYFRDIVKAHGYILDNYLLEKTATLTPTLTLTIFDYMISTFSGVVFIHAHSNSNWISVEGYPQVMNNGANLGLMARTKAYLRYTEGTDEKDPEVWAAINYAKYDGIDNDNNGLIDDNGDLTYKFHPEYDDNENGIIDEGGLDGPGDMNGDGAPGIAGFDDDADGQGYLISQVSPGGTSTGFLDIAVNRSFLDNKIQDNKNSIVFFGGCDTMSGPSQYGPGYIYQSFLDKGTKNYLGYNDGVWPETVLKDIKLVFGNMGGELADDGVRNNDDIGQTDTYYGKMGYYFLRESSGSNPEYQKIYNSPRIVMLDLYQDQDGNGSFETPIYHYEVASTYPYNPNTDYPGDLSNCPKNPALSNKTLQIKIKFSEPMDGSWSNFSVKFDPQQSSGHAAEPFNGSWSNTYLSNDTWIGTAIVPSGSDVDGKAEIQVKARDSYQGDVNEELDTNGDGNSEGVDTLHPSDTELDSCARRCG